MKDFANLSELGLESLDASQAAAVNGGTGQSCTNTAISVGAAIGRALDGATGAEIGADLGYLFAYKFCND